MNPTAQTVLRGGLAGHKRDLLLTLEYLLCMGPVTVFVGSGLDFVDGSSAERWASLVPVVLLASPLICLMGDLRSGRPPRSVLARCVLGLQLLTGCALTYLLVVLLMPAGDGRRLLLIVPLIVLPCVHGVRRLVWLGRDPPRRA